MKKVLTIVIALAILMSVACTISSKELSILERFTEQSEVSAYSKNIKQETKTADMIPVSKQIVCSDQEPEIQEGTCVDADDAEGKICVYTNEQTIDVPSNMDMEDKKESTHFDQSNSSTNENESYRKMQVEGDIPAETNSGNKANKEVKGDNTKDSKATQKDSGSTFDEIERPVFSGFNDTPITEIKDVESIKFTYQVIRDGSNTFNSNSVVVIRSVEKLKSILNGTNLKSVLNTYDEMFFETNVLFYIHVGTNSGSVQLSVKSVERTEAGTISIKGSVATPQIGTCDMAGWGIFVAVSSEDYSDGNPVTSNLIQRGIKSDIDI